MPLDLSVTSTKLLDKLGSSTYVTAIDESGQVLDPVTGLYSGGTESTTQLTAAVMKVTDSLIDGERIQVGDKRVIFDNKYTPTMSTKFKFGGVEYKTVMIDGFNHAGTQQYWDVICRK